MLLIDLTITNSRFPKEDPKGLFCILSGNVESGFYKEYYYDNHNFLTEYSDSLNFSTDIISLIFWNENKQRHNIYGPADICWMRSTKEYWLNNVYFGNQKNIPSDEYWIKYQKLLAFK